MNSSQVPKIFPDPDLSSSSSEFHRIPIKVGFVQGNCWNKVFFSAQLGIKPSSSRNSIQGSNSAACLRTRLVSAWNKFLRVSINGGTPKWFKWMVFVRGKSHRSKWMMTGGTPRTQETPIYSPAQERQKEEWSSVNYFCSWIRICRLIDKLLEVANTTWWMWTSQAKSMEKCSRMLSMENTAVSFPISLHTDTNLHLVQESCVGSRSSSKQQNHLWRFPGMGVPKNEWFLLGKTLLNVDDLGVPLL